MQATPTECIDTTYIGRGRVRSARMDVHVKRKVARAVAAAVQTLLCSNAEASIPGLGTFSTQYEPSRLEQQEDGSTNLVPPSRTVEFTPETSESDEHA